MTLSDLQFKDLHHQLRAEGGFSVNARSGKAPDVGYMVSIPGHEHQVRSQNVSPAHLKEYVEKHGKELDSDTRYFGGWNDTSKGEVSLDVSENLQLPESATTLHTYGKSVAKADALTSVADLAAGRGQAAAYDLETGKDVPSGYDPKTRRQNG